jgi:integrator complex subunit 4
VTKLKIRLHLNGKHLLTTNYYDDLKPHLNDDFDQVRLLAIEAITLLALTYPEFQVTVANNQEEDQLRLTDDVFAKLCIMINDISVEVKVCASA